MTKWEMHPTPEQTAKYKAPGISNSEAEYRALVENMKEVMHAINEDEMPDDIQTIYSVLSLLLDRC